LIYKALINYRPSFSLFEPPGFAFKI